MLFCPQIAVFASEEPGPNHFLGTIEKSMSRYELKSLFLPEFRGSKIVVGDLNGIECWNQSLEVNDEEHEAQKTKSLLLPC